MPRDNRSSGKILVAKNGKKFLIKDDTKDMHLQYGMIKADELNNEPGTELKTNKDYSLFLLNSEFMDLYHKMKRGAQIIPLKDIGFIIAELGLNRDSVVIDSGSGSGGLSLFLANIVKKVHSFDIRDDHIEIVQKNIDFLGIKNVSLKKGSVYTDKLPKNVDAVTLDVPEPWEAIDNVAKVLKAGGHIVSYSPCIPQVSDFVEAIRNRDDFVFLKTVEIIEREWEVTERRIRPKTQQRINHSGFLTFARKVKATSEEKSE